MALTLEPRGVKRERPLHILVADSVNDCGPMAASRGDGAPRHRPWLLASLQSPGQVLENLGPNWFASVMGTGIVATAGATLPVRIPGLHVFSLAVWVFADLLLVVIIIGVAAHWVRYPTIARSHVYNPQMAHFYGAAPMALLTVGSGALLLGKDLIGERAVVDLEWMLWTVGTVGGA